MSYREIEPHNDFDDLTTFTADIDLIANYGQMARSIEVIDAGSGTLSVITGAGNTRTVTVTDGEVIGPVFITDILLATDVAHLRVFI